MKNKIKIILNYFKGKVRLKDILLFTQYLKEMKILLENLGYCPLYKNYRTDYDDTCDILRFNAVNVKIKNKNNFEFNTEEVGDYDIFDLHVISDDEKLTWRIEVWGIEEFKKHKKLIEEYFNLKKY